MKIRKFIATALMTAMLILGGCVTAAHAQGEQKPMSYEVVPDDYFVMDASKHADIFSFVRIVTIGVAEGIYPKTENGETRWHKAETLFEQSGSGFVVKDGYVFTAAHVITPQIVGTPWDQNSVWATEPLRTLRQEILLFDFKGEPTVAKIFYVDNERDVAILRYTPNVSLRPMPYETIGTPLRMEPGTKVAAVVHERGEDGSISYALKVIYGEIVCDGVCMIPHEAAPWFNIWDFTMMLPIQPGDSGSPLFMLGLDGKPICVGIIRAASIDPLTGFYAYAVRFDRLLRLIEIVEENEAQG